VSSIKKIITAPEAKMNISRRKKVTAALPAALLTLAAVGCGHEEPVRHLPEQTPLAARVAVAQASPWSEGLEVTAGVQPLRRANLSTLLMGHVDAVLRTEGDTVRRGETLARVESREVDARLAQAEAAVAAARAAEKNAALLKGRMERLFERQAASQKNVDDATMAFEAATANRRAAEEGVKAAEMYVTYSEVTAPFAGVIVQKLVEVGDTAAPGHPLFVLEDVSKVKIEAHVPESSVAELSLGQAVEVDVQGQLLQGKLTELLPSADPRSRTFTVRVLLDNPERELRSGMFARLLFSGEPAETLAIPSSAIVRQGPLTGLFVVDAEDHARLRWVTLGRTRAGQTEVLTGLRPGERFVVAPGEELTDGRPVEVQG
jgi:RND family efflux transporter MFP subunit